MEIRRSYDRLIATMWFPILVRHLYIESGPRYRWVTTWCDHICHGPLTRYVKLRVAHAPGMPGTFSPPPTSRDTAWLAILACITARTYVPWCMTGSLTYGGRENVPGACANRNFKYLARGPWKSWLYRICMITHQWQRVMLHKFNFD